MKKNTNNAAAANNAAEQAEERREQAAAAEQANANTNTPKKAENRPKKAAAKNAEPKNTPNTNNAEKAEERKGNTMKKNAKNAAAEQAAPKAEQAAEQNTNAAADILTAEALKALYEQSMNAATPDARKAAREAFSEGREDFNAAALTNAVKRSSFLTAAEAFRPEPPKNAEKRENGVDYERRAERVQYIQIDEQGNAAARFLNLNTYAAEAFREGLTNAEQAAALTAALTALDVFMFNNVNNEKAPHEGLKAAAAALTALLKACGLDGLTAYKTPDGVFSAFVDKSFVLVTAARMKAKKGTYETPCAALEAARAAAVNASVNQHTRAAERLEKAEAAAVKYVFNIVSEALKAAVYGVWKADILTAEGVKAAAAAREAEEKRKAEERAAAKAAKLTARINAQKARKEKAEALLKKLTAEQAAAKKTA